MNLSSLRNGPDGKKNFLMTRRTVGEEAKTRNFTHRGCFHEEARNMATQ
ncbi:hypothetical protein [Actinomyces vulturis]|nr:hypothetical protein [Actinomyces vulturis]